MVDVWAIDSSGGAPSYSGYDLRLTTIAPFMAGAGTGAGVRTGVRLSGSGTDLLVQAQASPNMSVKVNPGVIVAQGTYTASQGPYTWALDTTTTLTISASHATLDRTDLVCVRIRDSNVDSSGSRDGNVIPITGTPGAGTPSLPTDATYVIIAQISVPHASTSVVSGNITDKRPFTAAPGAPIPCVSTARPTGLPNLRIIEIDTNYSYVWNGSKYLRDPVRLKATHTDFLNTTSPAPVTGMSVALDANSTYEWDLFSMVFGVQNVGCLLWLQIPSGATLDAQVAGWTDSSGSQFTANVNGATGNAQLGTNGWGYNVSSNRTSVVGKGTITTSATAGNAVLLGAQRVASGSGASYVDSQSWMDFRQVA